MSMERQGRRYATFLVCFNVFLIPFTEVNSQNFQSQKHSIERRYERALVQKWYEHPWPKRVAIWFWLPLCIVRELAGEGRVCGCLR